MPEFVLHLSGNCRATTVIVPNFSVLASVSPHMWNDRTGGYVERSEKMQINNPDFQHDTRLGLVFYNRRHNAFRDQERYNVMSRAFVNRQGTLYKYYTTSLNVNNTPLFHEDSNREVERVFDLPVLMGFNPQNELYSRFGIQYTTKQEIYVHMGLFLELNYRSLRELGVKPACDPNEHNPIWYQRGYEDFRYYGYTAAQIFPKAGDLLKLEFNNVLYQFSTHRTKRTSSTNYSVEMLWVRLRTVQTRTATLPKATICSPSTTPSTNSRRTFYSVLRKSTSAYKTSRTTRLTTLADRCLGSGRPNYRTNSLACSAKAIASRRLAAHASLSLGTSA